MTGSRVAAALAVALALLPGAAARAEPAWVGGQVRLNVRTGPGAEYRIVGVIETGDTIEVVQRGETWSKVRTGDGKEGWIPGGYLSSQPPPALRVDELEAELARLRQQLAGLEEANTRLAEGTPSREQDEAVRRAELDRLAAENRQLKAGARWPEWITGATILAGGILVGAVMGSLSRRRNARRIRL